MKSEVAERMNYLVAQSGRDDEGSAVDRGSGRSRCEGARVTSVTAHLIEKRIATNGRRRNRVLPARGPSSSHEVRKRQNIAAIVFRVGGRIEWQSGDVNYTLSGAGRIFVRTGVRCRRAAATKSVELVRNTHFVQIGIAGKRQKAGVLSFPTETANAQSVV